MAHCTLPPPHFRTRTWPLGTLVVLAFFWPIRRPEEQAADLFGPSDRDYQSRVLRWR